MGTSYSPSTVTDGLIFYYDEANLKKSWKGEPTTNLAVTSGSVTDWTIANLVASVTRGTITPDKKYSITSTTGGDFRMNFNLSNLVDTETYTLSFKYKIISGGPTFEIADWCDTTATKTTTDLGDGVFYHSGTGTRATYTSTYRFMDLTMSADTVVQRTTTQALVDLTNNSTITTGSDITYNSDNTYEHVAGDNDSTLSVPLSTSFNKLTGSINMWIYPHVYSGSNGLFVNRDSSVVNALDWFWIGSYGSGATFYFRLGDGVACCANDLTISSWSTVAPINTWTNVCVTWASAGLSQIFVNGVLHNSRSIIAIPSTNPTATGRIGLGHTSGGTTAAWDGKISPTAIYNRVLTNNEVKQNFETLRSRFGV